MQTRHHETKLLFLQWQLYEFTNSSAATRIVVAALTEQLPQCLSATAYTATMGQVQRLVDGLDAETCLAWAHELGPDEVPSFEAWAHTERPE